MSVRLQASARQFLMGLLMLLLSVGCFPVLVHAAWVTVEGRSPIYRGDLVRARETARQDALDQARLASGGRLQARDEMRDGQLVESGFTLESTVRIGRTALVSEQILDDWLSQTWRIQVLPQPLCAQTPASRFRKRVAVTRFGLSPESGADLGRLYPADEDVPLAMVALLSPSTHLQTINATDRSLYRDSQRAPTIEAEDYLPTQTTELARRLGVQFVVGGVVRSLALVDPEAFRSSPWGSLLRTVRISDRRRVFVADLYLYDGFSGSLLYQRRFSTQADWDTEAEGALPIGSPVFRQTAYGAAVQEVLRDMAAAVEAQVACQPFMTRIRRTEGRTLMIESGTSQGLQPGDTLQVYRSRELFDGVRYQGTALREVPLTLQLSQVQPDFAMGDVPLDPTRYNIQSDDLVIIW